MTKIGILTFHRASNFGGALQCYALAIYLTQKGYNAEIIDYRSPAIEKFYSLIRFDNFKTFVYSILHFTESYRFNKHFREFRRNIPISNKAYYNAKELSGKYDIVLVGSDQVWNKRINRGFDPIFWGNISGNTKVVSYAASMGTNHIYTSEEYQLISTYLKNFHSISVREKSLEKELSRFTDKPIKTVIDPTLLLTSDDYLSITDTSNLPFKKYVLFYQMEYNPKSIERVEEVAEQLDCSVVIIGGPKRTLKMKTKHYKYADLEVSRFLGLYKNATCVFASSFHGTALSIMFQKDFYFFEIRAIDRARNLLIHVGALDRMISPHSHLKFTPVDYDSLLPKLEEFRIYSQSFIDEVLQHNN